MSSQELSGRLQASRQSDGLAADRQTKKQVGSREIQGRSQVGKGWWDAAGAGRSCRRAGVQDGWRAKKRRLVLAQLRMTGEICQVCSRC